MEGFSITFGDPAAQAQFAQEYCTFLIEWRELQETVKKVMLNRTIGTPDITKFEGLPDEAPEVVAAEDRYKADLSTFVLARTAVDDFSELLILASNGFGVGALKTLRGMYERIVTSAYVALFPEVSRSLIDSIWTHRWKVWRRATHLVPELASKVDPGNIEDLKKRAADAQARVHESICKECKEIKQVHAWTKVDLSTMAEMVDKKQAERGVEGFSLSNYYLRCYLEPTAREHATGTSINEKFDYVDGQWTYKMDSSKERRLALLFGHVLLLMLLSLQNDHFGYGLDDELNARATAYKRVWTATLPDDVVSSIPD